MLKAKKLTLIILIIWSLLCPIALGDVLVVDPGHRLTRASKLVLGSHASNASYRPLVAIEEGEVGDYSALGRRLLKEYQATDILLWTPKQDHVELISSSLDPAHQASIIQDLLPLLKQGETTKALELGLVGLEMYYQIGPLTTLLGASNHTPSHQERQVTFWTGLWVIGLAIAGALGLWIYSGIDPYSPKGEDKLHQEPPPYINLIQWLRGAAQEYDQWEIIESYEHIKEMYRSRTGGRYNITYPEDLRDSNSSPYYIYSSDENPWHSSNDFDSHGYDTDSSCDTDSSGGDY